MGRGKSLDVEPRQTEELDSVAHKVCAICADKVEREEEFLRVYCNKCNECTVHLECGIDYLIARASEKTNSGAQNKYKVKARKQPVQIFEQRMPCPQGASQVENDGLRVPGSQNARSKHAVAGTCGGFTTGAQLVKPPKDPPAPLPQILPARAPKEKKDRDRKEGGKAAAPKRASTASSVPAPRRPGPGVPAPGAGAGARLLGAAHPPWTTVGGRKGSVAAGATAAGAPRPLELTLCRHLVEDGDCFVYRCPAAHSQEELQEREKEWAAKQEAKKREAARRHAAAQAAAAARFEEEQALLAQIASMEALHTDLPSTHPVPNPWGTHGASASAAGPAGAGPVGMRLTELSLSLLRAFKRSCCLNALLSMGFGAEQAAAATDAAACDAERAAQLAIDGVRAAGTLPANVSKEAEELASAAAAAGADAEAVEAALVLTGGNWQAAIDALHSPQEYNAPAGSTATAEDVTSWAPSEPDTPSQHLPTTAPWAADAVSSLSAPSPYSASPGCAPALSAAAVPGVLSLADFSAGPAPEAEPAVASRLAGAWLGLADVHGSEASSDVFSMAQPSGTAADVLMPPAPSASGYQDGFAAGMAAAAAMYVQQQPSHIAGTPAPWPAPPAAHQDAEEELSDLLQLLGVASL